MTDDAQYNQNKQFRRSMYAILLTLAAGMAVGRILAVDSVDAIQLEEKRLDAVPQEVQRRRVELVARGVTGQKLERELKRIRDALTEEAKIRRPFLSANDRSRWCTIRVLVEKDLQVPGWPYAIDNVIQQQGWDTIDMVKHDGHLFSSKPPLLPTLIAGEYWLIHHLSDWVFGEPYTLGERPYTVGRLMLITVNVIPWIIALALLAKLVEQLAVSDWTRIFIVAAGCFATTMNPFLITLNNHLPAAVCVAIALERGVHIWFSQERRFRDFALAGLFGSFAVACELPALAFLGLLGLALLWRSPKHTLVAFVPAMLIVAAGFFYTTYAAHGRLTIPYAERGEGTTEENWYDYTYERNGKLYESYWRNRIGIDRGEPSRAVYALHVLVGHHGIFSLTPMWILAFAGMAMWVVRPADARPRVLGAAIAVITLVCLAFYLMRGQDDRNYGGMCCTFRWMLWFVPMWLLAMIPALDRMARSRMGRGVALVLLALSALSAAYPTWNPWTHPWLFKWMEHVQWIAY